MSSSWIFWRCHIVPWSQTIPNLAVSVSLFIKPFFHGPRGVALATISLAHRGTTTRRAMRSGDVGEKGAEAGIVSEGFSDLPRLWITLLYYSPYMIVSLCIYLWCIMLQARDKETEFLVIPVPTKFEGKDDSCYLQSQLPGLLPRRRHAGDIKVTNNLDNGTAHAYRPLVFFGNGLGPGKGPDKKWRQ